ncbi:MAG: 50S ribosomal protein L25 [Patescibacteria group bacterium]
MTLTLEVKPRDSKESTEALRGRGAVPAVFYGPKEASTAVVVDGRKLSSIWKQAGETTIITLTGIGEGKDTLIHDVQFHPVTSALLHADFYVLEKGKKITIKVPLVFEGQAPAEKAGHIVVKAMHEIEIEVAPAELPHNLPVDISALENVGDHITAAQVKLPASATLITDAHETVVSVTAFVEEKIEEPVVAPAVEGAEGAAPAEGAEAAPAATEAKSKAE